MKNRGITLIALVITIIVLLILAGVTISMIAGETGILTKGKQASEKTNYEQAKEEINLAVSAAYAGTNGEYGEKFKTTVVEELTKLEIKNITQIEDIVKGIHKGYVFEINTATGVVTVKENETGSKPEGSAIPGEIVVEKNKKYENNGTAIIPVGFAIVPGCENVAEGLVISDKANDTTNQGNQFVWIPVTDYNQFIIRAGYYNKSIQSMSNHGEANATGNNTNTGVTENPTTVNEAKLMYQSVKDNGGFYIGRYESGIDSETQRTNSSGITDPVVVKKNKNVYNSISWSNSKDMTNVTGGAVQKAREMYQKSDTCGVKSTLCYSVQWDTALNFIDPGYTGYAKDSSKQGWYIDNYNSTTGGNTETNLNYITGKDLIYSSNVNVIANKQKNIYDMAGNVKEWTMESYDNNKRVYRGACNKNTSGLDYPASLRFNTDPDGYNDGYGFRIALYL